MAGRRLGSALALGLTGLVVAGCGSASSSGQSGAAAHTTTLPSGQLIVDAADRTNREPGYRIAATITINTGEGAVHATVTGTAERRDRRSALRFHETVNGRAIELQMRVVGDTLYMSGIPGLATISHGRPWIRFDLAAVARANGVGDLQTEASTDPTRYLAYLRAIGGQIERIGTASIRGVATTRYHAVIDLDRYVADVPPAERTEARRSIAILEAAIGGHTLPVNVWIDARHEIRQLQLGFRLCAESQSVLLSMTMDLHDYGRVPAVTIPSAAASYNVTPSLNSAQTSSGGCAAGG